MQHNVRFMQLVENARHQVKHIESVQLFDLLNKKYPVFVVDVREKEEFDRGHLPGAMHLSKGVLERDIEKMIPNPDAEIVVYCSGGFRSILAALTALMVGLFCGPITIRWLKGLQIGQMIRDDGPQTHLSKAGTPTMGGVLILIAITASTLLWGDLRQPSLWIVLLVTLS